MTILPGVLPAPVPSGAATGAPAVPADGAAGRTPQAVGFLEMLLAALPTVPALPNAAARPGPTSGDLTGPEQELPADAAEESPDTALSQERPDTAVVATPLPALLAVLAQQPFAVLQSVRLAEAQRGTPAAVPATGDLTTDATAPDAQSAPLAVSLLPHGTGDAASTPAASTLGTAGAEGTVGTAASALSGAPVQGALTTADQDAEAGTETGPVAAARGLTDADSEADAAVTTRAVTVPATGTATGTAPGTATAATTSTGTGTVDVSTLTPVTSTTSSVPVTGVSPITSAPVAQPATDAAPAPVVQQVIPEISRLAARGDGTHRLTMTLSPEALGDVRVTLTVNNGRVTVNFQAGDEAQRALIESAPELRRLLELTGATESRVTVRDALGSSPAAQSTAGQNTAGQQGHGQAAAGEPDSGTGGQDPTDTRRDHQDHHAGTRDGQNATDGSHRGTGENRRPLDQVTSTRSAGLDVTV